MKVNENGKTYKKHIKILVDTHVSHADEDERRKEPHLLAFLLPVQMSNAIEVLVAFSHFSLSICLSLSLSLTHTLSSAPSLRQGHIHSF